MKKVVTLSLLTISFLVTKAQTGTVLVGGNVGIETSSDDASALTLSPLVGYQFNKNWTAGVVADYTSQKQEDAGMEFKVSALAVGPFVRYTQTLSDIFSVFGQLSGQYVSGKSEIDGETFSEANGVAVKLYPAVFINVKNGFGLNFDFGGLNYASLKPKGGSSESAFQFNFGKTINIGISKNFGGKSK